MKQILWAMCLCCAASPALALKVTNLDTVEHNVQLEAAGSMDVRSIAPAATTTFYGQADGRLSLLSMPPIHAKSTFQADGLLSGVIGEGRNQDIPTNGRDEYVIWPGGKMQLQRRMKEVGNNN